MLLYSASGRAAIPFLGGTLCAATPVQRTPAVYSNTGVPAWYTCAGMFEIDMAAFAHGLLGGSPSPLLTTVGTVIDCQWWGRDKGSNPAFAATFSDALEYTVIP
jgi:hypothetical protein